MNILETTSTAYTALKANKIRSALTMLGVIIGVMAVILLISIGKGVQNYITDQFEALGSNLLFVSPGKADFGNDPASQFSRNKLEDKHVKLIERYAGDYGSLLSPYITVGATAEYKTKKFYASVNALNEDGFELLNFQVNNGRFFSKTEVRAKSKVAVLGQEVVNELFQTRNPLGQKISIEDDTFEVIGTFAPKGSNFDDGIVMPYTTAENVFGSKNFSSITIKVKNPEEISRAMKQIEKALLRDLKEDEFTVLSQQDVLSSIQSILGMLTLGLGAIAGISLIVGGIGIMNIMLVSVTERTREIGLRKAIGATPNEIALQFLLESTLISVSGGTVGIILGYMGSLAARGFLRTEVPWWSVILAFSFSAFVGIIFGTYPAVKASKKDPIEALRYE